MTPVASTTRAILALAAAVQLAAGPALADDHPLASPGASLPFTFAGGAAEPPFTSTATTSARARGWPPELRVHSTTCLRG